MNTSTDVAGSFIKYLIENGVSDFVISPGSRNAPLSIALYEASKKGLIDLHIKIDERGAAFFALGLSKASDNYVAVTCTSGTAVANYLPAALESLHSDSKVIFLTADRPEHLRKTGANQTTNQVDIFNGIKTYDLDYFEPVALKAGPIHINLKFDEPLLTEDKSDWLAGISVTPSVSSPPTVKEKLNVSGNGLVIVGHDKGGFTKTEISNFARGLPLISEDPASFPESIEGASLFLADLKVRDYLKPDYVIVIGRTTLSRSINSFVAFAPKQYVIDKRLRRIDSERKATKLFEQFPELEIESIAESYRRDFEIASRESKVDLNWSEPFIARTLVGEIPDEAALFVGSVSYTHLTLPTKA